MLTIDEIRHANLLRLIDRAGSIQAVASRLGKSHAQISQLKNRNTHSGSSKPRNMGPALAREIERVYGLSVGWMDNVGLPFPDERPEGGPHKPLVDEMLRRRSTEEKRAWLEGIKRQLHRDADLYTEEELAEYRVALDKLDAPDPGRTH